MGANNSAEKAQRRAEQAERERQAGIRRATSRIDAAFEAPERQAQYADFGAAVRSYLGEDLNRQKADTDRQLKFSMARSGLTGGSASADAGRNLADEYRRGLLKAERKAQGQVADLRSADEQSRLNLIQLAQSGLDATSGARQAANAMQTNIAGARATGEAEGLGDIFGNTAKVYDRQRKAAEDRRRFPETIWGTGVPSSPWG